jgi:hypothetical protein
MKRDKNTRETNDSPGAHISAETKLGQELPGL